MSKVDDYVVDVLVERVVDTLAKRGEGHCLQVSHVPTPLADAACRLVDRQLSAPDIARVVVKSPVKDWHATPAKIVEARNVVEESGGRLALFVPAGQHVAAEDSFGRSTFEMLALDDIHDSVAERLRRELQAIAPDIAERAETVLASRRDADGLDRREMAAYLARLVDRPSEDELGRALVELGLLPDQRIGDEGDAELRARLERNHRQMKALTEVAPPADRVQALSLSADADGARQLTESLLAAVADGTTDARQIARRLDESDGLPDISPLVGPTGPTAALQELRIVSTGGDFVRESDPPTLKKANAAVRVKYRCRPAAGDLPGLGELRLQLLIVGEQGTDLAPTGIELTKRGKSLPRNKEGNWTMRLRTQDLDAGLYRIRLQAVDSDNLVLEQVLSETFKIHEEIEGEFDLETHPVPSIAAARVEAHTGGAGGREPGAALVGAASAEGNGTASVFTIRFDGVPGRWQFVVSRLLALVERYTLEDPRSLARYRLSLENGEIEETIPVQTSDAVRPFLDARERLFETVVREQHTLEAGSAGPLVALCDLTALRPLVEEYVVAWSEALKGEADPAAVRDLLRIDQVGFGDDGLDRAQTVGPTHPLRLGWLVGYQQVLNDWVSSGEASEAEGRELRALLPSLVPANLPHVLFGEHEELRYLEPLDLGWALWTPPSAADAGGLAARVRDRLGLPRATVGAVDVDAVVQRIRRYLVAHPYADVLQINFVHAGLGDVVLRTLLALQAEPVTAELRYVVRLFGSDLARVELGRALDEFMADPDAMKGFKRESADAFLSSTDDPLTPKLIYSKHAVEELLDRPGRFPSHLTFFLDWFELDAVPVPPLDDRRSFFAGGLIVDPVVVYRGADGDMNPQWDEHVIARGTGDPWLLAAYAESERATAGLLGPDTRGTVPAVRLELDKVRRSILDAVHGVSDWVVVIDPVFTEEYLDAPASRGDVPRYLIDSSDPGALDSNRRIMVSTRSRTELSALLEPVLVRYGLELPEDRVEVLLDALQALSAGLPLKLLNNRTQALEAMSLSLATLTLAARGVLRHALVIPLDMHTDLFRENRSGEQEGATDLRRTDLAVIRVDAERRLLGVNLVEVKARGRLPGSTPTELVEQIGAQLANTEDVLRSRLFSSELRQQPGSLAGALMVRRLTRLLGRYAERALRHGYLDPGRMAGIREFLSTLDRSYSFAFEKHALLFDLEGPSAAPETIGGVRVQRIGREEIADLLSRTQTPVGTHPLTLDPDSVRTVFGAGGDEDALEQVADVEVGLGRSAAEDEDESIPRPPDSADGDPAGGDEQTEDGGPPAVVEGPRPEDVLILGGTPRAGQFGIVGRIGGSREVAFDVDGTNVVSVFGVQGSGKSYSVGNLIEAALIRRPELNRLPRPLAGVVFHYSTDETYLPEFAAMIGPNDDPETVRELERDYGAPPTPVSDVGILVPEDLVEQRRDDFPGMDVGPLVLAPDELNINDWKLLMGVEGGEQLYVKALTNIFRRLRGALTVKALRRAVGESNLNPQQKNIADQRLDFVANFVKDGGGVADRVAAGRLLVVDVRDPLMDEEEVLSLFMVLLRLFSQARAANGASLNKLIVFDEAHKYMGNPRLTGAIVEAVREMRHKGTSVVLASQNPPSIPREVIELSSVIVAHKFTAPTWLEHIRKVNSSFGRDLTPAQLATLAPGEAFVWSGGGAEQLTRPQRTRMRPRLSRHGGATRRATGN